MLLTELYTFNQSRGRSNTARLRIFKLEFGLGKRCTPALKQATRSVSAGERVRVKGFLLPLFPFPFCP
ncbi:hypothetical protein FDUTEX481_06814 [Tolypothrix sp. PCC 7601]|nr:hypothetical protein FDUTEX481_06814 [Tolypothrix sp. PCC 7601]